MKYTLNIFNSPTLCVRNLSCQISVVLPRLGKMNPVVMAYGAQDSFNR